MALITLCLLCSLRGPEEPIYQVDVRDAAAWEARPTWLANPAETATVRTREEGLEFFVAEPNRGMKWRRDLPVIFAEEARYLVLRYRAVNYHPSAGDYVIWLHDENPDGQRIIKGRDLTLDGQWHTYVFDLRTLPSQIFDQMALQVQAAEAGEAHLFVRELVFTNALPPEVPSPAEPPYREISLPLRASQWQAMPSWLGNPTGRPEVRAAEVEAATALRFIVDEAGRGMKWRCLLEEPLDLAGLPYVTLRYRAEGLAPRGDYLLYLGSDGSGRAPQEARPLRPEVLEADGTWHVVTAPVPTMQVAALALQVQAAHPQAWLEVATLTFSSRRPQRPLREVLPFRKGWGEGPQPYQPLALPANAEVAPWLVGLGLAPVWFPQSQVTVADIPFQVRPEAPQVLATPLKEVGQVTIPIGRVAEAIYLLLGARFIGPEEPSLGRGELRRVRQVERFLVQVDYADGVSDLIFPRRLPSQQPLLVEEPGVYLATPTRQVSIRQITLRDGMRRGGFYLAGVTLGPAPSPRRREEGKEGGPLRRVPVTALAATTVGLTLDEGRRRAVALTNRATGTSWLTEPSVLFAVEAEGPLKAQLSIRENPPQEVILRLSLTNTGPKPVKVTPTFPQLLNLSPGGDPDDLGYCFPRRGAVINTMPISLREPYSGRFPLQFISVYHPQAGGIYLLTHDTANTPKWFWLRKRDTVSLGVEYWPRTLQPGETWELPEAALGAHAGDWHLAFEAYRRWKETWYRPLVPRKQWFREVFNFRQQFLHFALPRKSGLFEADTKTFRVEEVLATDEKAFGGVDYLHLFDWGWTPTHGRCGDYRPWDYLGGADNFRRAVEAVQKRGIPVGLYIEGYLIDPPSEVAQAHGREWQLLRADGTPYTNFAPSFHLCPHLPAWQEYLTQTYVRAARETGANGFYIDEFGFAAHYICHNPAHGHPVPLSPLRGEAALTRKVREALPPEAVVYTEETPTDVTSQYQDGSFTYAISSVSDEWSPTHVNLTRFALPDFKTFEIIVCDRPLGSDVQSVKRIFFNGEGIWIEGIPEAWFTPETRAFIARMHRILREHSAAFTSLNPRPLVPTLRKGVYANEFPAEEETVWTLYNACWETVRGELLAVPHRDGAVYRDLWRGQPLTPRVEGGRAYLTLELEPRGVGCVSRSTAD